MISLQRILVPTDFSETSDAALKYGVELARTFGASLTVLHVVTEPLHESWACCAPADAFFEVVERFKGDAQKRLALLVTPEEVVSGRVTLKTTWGNAIDQILKYASDDNADLIVCGTHGRRGWAHVALGSVAENVVRRAPCPVLTVHNPEHEFVLPDLAVNPVAARA